MVKGDTRGNLRRFRAALRDIAPDLLVTSNWGSIEWALARIGTGVPHLHMEDGFGPEERTRQLPRRVLARRLLLRRATVVVPSVCCGTSGAEIWRLPQSRLRLSRTAWILPASPGAAPRDATSGYRHRRRAAGGKEYRAADPRSWPACPLRCRRGW